MKRNLSLLLLLLVLAGGIALLESTKGLALKDAAPQMLDAAERMQRAMEALRGERLRRGIAIDAADDPNHTGMIGQPYTEITTTLGSLEAKRSTTNPNLAAMIVDMFTELGIGAGNRIAVNLSGSFPCANIAVLCAMDAMGIDGVIFASVGASTYGANLPEFTYLDMEHYLYENGLVGRRSAAFSLGGQDDLGLEMPEDVRDTIRTRLTEYGYTCLSYAELDENIMARVALYDAGSPIRCLVNVGGNLLSFGTGSGMTTAPGGIITKLPSAEAGNGLVQHYLAQGVPVLHLLNMKGLLPAYGLPYDPVPLPLPGEGGVYYEEAYSVPLLVVICAAAVLGLAYFARRFRTK